jgi:hypothetical protein
LLASNAFIVDACRHVVRHGSNVVSLATRPVLFSALARALAEAWPGDRPERRSSRVHSDPSSLMNRIARLRVEIGRLRAEPAFADVGATKRGLRSRLAAHARSSSWRDPSTRSTRRCSLSQPTTGRRGPVPLALALGQASGPCSAPSTRSRQPAKCSRSAAVARRWMTPPPGFHDDIVTPAPLPID